MSDTNYWQSVWARRLSRRAALRGAAVSGLSVAALSVIACGSDSNTATPATTTATSSASPTATASASVTASPSGTATTPPTATGTVPGTVTGSPTATPSASGTPAGKAGGKISWRGFSGEPPGYDPHLQINSQSLGAASYTYSRLMKFKTGAEDDTIAFALEPEGDLAESLESPDNGTTWNVKLRQNVKWHNRAPANGRPFNSADVKWNLDRFMKDGLGKDPFVRLIDSYQTPDDFTVVFKLKSPYVPFPSTLANPIGLWMVNREVVEADGDANKNMLGTGPWMTQVWQTGTGMLTKKNPDYFVTGYPLPDELDALLIADSKTYVGQFRSEALDVLRITTPEDKDAILSSNPNVVNRTVNTVDDEWFFFEPASYPWAQNKAPFNDQRVRQAISMAIDRDSMIEAFYASQGTYCAGYMFANYGPWYLNPKDPSFATTDYPDAAKVYQYNVDEAKKLMAAAGHENGVDGDINLHFTTAYGEAFQSHVQACADFAKQIGINFKLVPEEYGQYISNTFLGNFDGAAFGLPPVYTAVDDLLTGGLHPESSRNHSKINDPKLTEMIEKQRTIVDQQERINLVHDIVRYTSEQSYYPSTVMGQTFYLSQPWVHDWATQYGYGTGTESFLSIWTDKT